METVETVCRICEEAAAEYCFDCALGYFWGGVIFCALFMLPLAGWLVEHVIEPVCDWLGSLIRGARAKSEYYQLKLAKEKSVQSSEEEKEAP